MLTFIFISMKHTILIIPGLGDSGTGHWQNYWLEHFPNAVKVRQDNWAQPQLNEWLIKLQQTIAAIDGPIIAVAHSLAVSLFVHWTERYNDHKLIGALLVAPADVDSPLHTPAETWNFSPIPTSILPFPSIVVTSTNDPYITKERAEELAMLWGSDFVNVGALGHINSASSLEYWKEGQEILQRLIFKTAKNSPHIKIN